MLGTQLTTAKSIAWFVAFARIAAVRVASVAEVLTNPRHHHQ